MKTFCTYNNYACSNIRHTSREAGIRHCCLRDVTSMYLIEHGASRRAASLLQDGSGHVGEHDRAKDAEKAHEGVLPVAFQRAQL